MAIETASINAASLGDTRSRQTRPHASFNITPSMWQIDVMPEMSAAFRRADSKAFSGEFMRADDAQALQGPNLALCWSEQIGWHNARTSVRSSVPMGKHPIAEVSAGAGPMAHVRADAAPAPAGLSFEKPVEKLASEESEAAVAKRLTNRYAAMLAEAAHDIRAPLASAQLIIASLARRAQGGFRLNEQDVELLGAAHSRLGQASDWAEGILLERHLRQDKSVSIRKRFYPHQWRNAIAPVLDGLATRHGVKLSWIGWDRSLPRLYLDPNQLSRAVVNLTTNAIEASLPGAEVCVRVAWQTNITERLVLAIEDTAQGLDASLMKRINATEGWNVADADCAGLGLKTAKSLVESLGGLMDAQRGMSGGTLMRMTLPVDNRPSLIRAWLLRNASEAAKRATTDSEVRHTIRLHAIRSSDINPVLADQQLQLMAETRDFVYRLGAERWAWIEISDSGAAPNSSRAEKAARRLKEIGIRSSESANCRSTMVYQLSNFALHRLLSASNVNERLPYITNCLSRQVEQLLGGRVPPVDDLTLSRRALEPMKRAGDAIRVRRDAGATLVRRQHVGGKPKILNAAAKAAAGRQAESIATSSTLTATEKQAAPSTPSQSESARDAISEVARQWRMIQAKLETLQMRLSANAS